MRLETKPANGNDVSSLLHFVLSQPPHVITTDQMAALISQNYCKCFFIFLLLSYCVQYTKGKG